MAIRDERKTVLQMLYQISPLFIRRRKWFQVFCNKLAGGNIGSRRLIITCDYCGLKDLARRKHQFPHWAGSHGKFNDSELCIPCYEIHKLLKK